MYQSSAGTSDIHDVLVDIEARVDMDDGEHLMSLAICRYTAFAKCGMFREHAAGITDDMVSVLVTTARTDASCRRCKLFIKLCRQLAAVPVVIDKYRLLKSVSPTCNRHGMRCVRVFIAALTTVSRVPIEPELVAYYHDAWCKILNEPMCKIVQMIIARQHPEFVREFLAIEVPILEPIRILCDAIDARVGVCEFDDSPIDIVRELADEEYARDVAGMIACSHVQS